MNGQACYPGLFKFELKRFPNAVCEDITPLSAVKHNFTIKQIIRDSCQARYKPWLKLISKYLYMPDYFLQK